jgi:hypothetical protein
MVSTLLTLILVPGSLLLDLELLGEIEELVIDPHDFDRSVVLLLELGPQVHEKLLSLLKILQLLLHLTAARRDQSWVADLCLHYLDFGRFLGIAL